MQQFTKNNNDASTDQGSSMERTQTQLQRSQNCEPFSYMKESVRKGLMQDLHNQLNLHLVAAACLLVPCLMV